MFADTARVTNVRIIIIIIVASTKQKQTNGFSIDDLVLIEVLRGEKGRPN